MYLSHAMKTYYEFALENEYSSSINNSTLQSKSHDYKIVFLIYIDLEGYWPLLGPQGLKEGTGKTNRDFQPVGSVALGKDNNTPITFQGRLDCEFLIESLSQLIAFMQIDYLHTRAHIRMSLLSWCFSVRYTFLFQY